MHIHILKYSSTLVIFIHVSLDLLVCIIELVRSLYVRSFVRSCPPDKLNRKSIGFVLQGSPVRSLAGETFFPVKNDHGHWVFWSFVSHRWFKKSLVVGHLLVIQESRLDGPSSEKRPKKCGNRRKATNSSFILCFVCLFAGLRVCSFILVCLLFVCLFVRSFLCLIVSLFNAYLNG